MNPWNRIRGVVLVAALIWTACGTDDDSPQAIARAFANAVQRGDAPAVLGLMERQAVERVQAAAERASNQVGGRRNIDTREMLQIVDIDVTFQLAAVEVQERSQDQASVTLVDAAGKSYPLEMVREQGQWRVRVAIPDLGGES